MKRAPLSIPCRIQIAFTTIQPVRSSIHRQLSTSATPNADPRKHVPVPTLNRPIGFAIPPRKVEPFPTFMQRTKALFTTPGQHKEILEEEGGSYWADFHAMRVNNGKQWIAPQHLFKAEKSLYFPNLAGRSLASDEADLLSLLGTPTLVRVFSATSGEEHVHKLGDDLGIQVVDINIQTNKLKLALLKAFLGRIKTLIEPARHNKYLILGSGYEKRLKAIGVINAYVGYAYLLDKVGKIRWASCGKLGEDERENLSKVTARLVELGQ